MKLIDSLHLEHVEICTPWLEAEDYPLLLGILVLILVCSTSLVSLVFAQRFLQVVGGVSFSVVQAQQTWVFVSTSRPAVWICP